MCNKSDVNRMNYVFDGSSRDTVTQAGACVNGQVGNYDCQGINLLRQWTLADLTVSVGDISYEVDSGNDLWGWTDPNTGTEYALMGLSNGTAFVDIINSEYIAFFATNDLNIPGKCAAGYVNDCADSDCCPESWIGDGLCDGTDQEWGCDLTCYSNDGGDCSSFDNKQLAAEKIDSVSRCHPDGSCEGMDSDWRDIKTYGDYAYIVSEEAGHDMQVVNLQTVVDEYHNLNDLLPLFYESNSNGPLTTVGDFGQSHNIFINEDTGFAYVLGSSSEQSCGILIYNLNNDPASPQEIDCSDAGSTYYHDLVTVDYSGPDEAHQFKEIGIGSAGNVLTGSNSIVILDLSNKNAITEISEIFNSDFHYSHQAWLSEDHTTLYYDDELDEYNNTNQGQGRRTFQYDISDLDNPVLEAIYERNDDSQIDHNLYVRAQCVFQSNYTSGLEVYHVNTLQELAVNGTGVGEIIDIDQNDLIAYFDTYPGEQIYWDGSWSNYPFFNSGNIIVSDISGGLFVLELDVGVLRDCDICEGVKGDVTADGAINVLDVISVVNDIVENSDLTGCRRLAADINENNTVDVSDVMPLINIIIEQDAAESVDADLFI